MTERCSPGALPPQVAAGCVWVFAYGSLMWRPDFVHVEARPALLHGWHRAMCILSTHYRGTEARPGLVLGLDCGGSCRGRAFRVAEEGWLEVCETLHAREMITGVYRPRFLPVRLDDGRRVPAWSFIVDRRHRHIGFLAGGEAADLDRKRRGLPRAHDIGCSDRDRQRARRRVDADPRNTDRPAGPALLRAR